MDSTLSSCLDYRFGWQNLQQQLYHGRAWALNFGRKIFCPVAVWLRNRGDGPGDLRNAEQVSVRRTGQQTEYSLQDRTERQGEKDADENLKNFPDRGIYR